MRYGRRETFSSRPTACQQLGILRRLLPADRLPYFQIDIFTTDAWCFDGHRRRGVVDVSVTAARKNFVSLDFLAGPARRRIADAVAARDGRQRSTMERTGRQRG